jgi:hypothetical protein
MELPIASPIEDNIFKNLSKLFQQDTSQVQLSQTINCWVKNIVFNQMRISHIFTLQVYHQNTHTITYDLLFYYHLYVLYPKSGENNMKQLKSVFCHKQCHDLGKINKKDNEGNIQEIKEKLKQSILKNIEKMTEFREKLKTEDYYYDRIFNKIYFDLENIETQYNILSHQLRDFYNDLEPINKTDECGVCREICGNFDFCKCNNYLCFPCLSKLTSNICPFCRQNMFFSEEVDEYDDDDDDDDDDN